MQKRTPQEIYEVVRDITYQKLEQGTLPVDWALPPHTWEEVSKRDRAIYAVMALKMNSIASEFTGE